ncbi:MAG: 4'-phosphopantetheinyl transferase superfamily protein [Deltaproteobacteria bacterium]|jgi:4'-phosphopantetheinyl transferase|nr:4'-phosphopantetheinyl transferase superfamily protein [Deltaproteobacteria bacterium]MBT6492026.1 4'-phosphopantetheinyl transferase superfamily protein [Deltaproteobacteria bacterium]
MESATESSLDAQTVHLWWATDRGLDSNTLKQAYFHQLTTQEKERYQRFMFQKDSDLYLLTRALCRKVLSKYVATPPSSWLFETNSYGKPSVSYPEAGQYLEFNLTNTPGLVACMVSDRYHVGVDAEAFERQSTTLDIAKRFFSKREFAELQTHGPDALTKRFFHYWTLKEAYIKVRGMGMSIPLADFSMVENDEMGIEVVHHTEGEHTQYHWHFEQCQLEEKYLLGMSVRLPEVMKPQIIIREMPLI